MKTACTGATPALVGAEVQPLEVQVGLEGLALPAESVAADGDVQSTERLLRGAGEVGGGVGDVRSASRIMPAQEP